jgi:hypothetical protein
MTALDDLAEYVYKTTTIVPQGIALPQVRPVDCHRNARGWMGDQSLALRTMAAGQIAGLWKVITPKTLGIDGSEADQLAGAGMVMTSGYNPDGPS